MIRLRVLEFVIFSLALTQFPLASATGNYEEQKQVRFVLSARALPDTEMFSNDLPDAYVKVTYYKSPAAAASHEINTEVIENSYNPDWETLFEVTYVKDHKQKLKFEILDQDTGIHDDVIGSVEISLSQMVHKNKLRLPITGSKHKHNNGELIIYSMVNREATEDTPTRLSNSKVVAKHFHSLLH